MKDLVSALDHRHYLLILLIVPFAIYLVNIGAPFQLDSYNIVHSYPTLHWDSISWDNVRDAFLTNGQAGPSRGVRGLVMLSFAFQNYVHGPDPVAFHLVNNALHACNAMLVYIFFFFLIKRKQSAFILALCWSIHPIHTESVTYIAQRLTLVSTFGILTALIFFLRFQEVRRWHNVVGILFGSLIALAGKELGYYIPWLCLLLYAVYYQDRSFWRSLQFFYLLASVMVITACLVYFLQANMSEHLNTIHALPDRVSTVDRLLTQPRVVWQYIALLIFPHPSQLMLDHHVVASAGWLTPLTTLLSLIGLIGLLVAAVWSLWKGQRHIGCGIVWFLGTLVMESSVIRLEMMFQHRTYLPSIGAVLIVFGLFRLARGMALARTGHQTHS